ncbi:O-methyltransferase [Vagococcus humatus]|uniref:tRNA 5-hydroxyuridine methyltransferase n=1 Tax=Vagococcus humatus TaxID=1889241 RepID=A0A429Z6W6_9ENTE|nr:O-methyltransferase [Vagococcus humatus]RST89442.1 O-methyltransferase [Vagococcus humatus]
MQNRMMDLPVVQKNVLEAMRTKQKPLTGKLKELEERAHEERIPIIPHETVVFLQFLLTQVKPKRILEIGTAIGFSASLMAECLPEDGQVVTIDRFDVMINKAKHTFKQMDNEDKITLLEGQASDILPEIKEMYDFIFLDCAKSKYIEFLPICLEHLRVGGVIMIDDVFQGGTVFEPIESIHRSQRAIHRKLNELFDKTLNHPDLTASLLPLGDGVLLLTKLQEDIVL